MIKIEYTDVPTCPYCFDRGSGFSGEEEILICYSCKEKFHAERIIEVSYVTRKLTKSETNLLVLNGVI